MTQEDAASLRYFIEEKGDASRWCDWEGKRSSICAELPELSDWLTLQRMADTMKRAVIEKLRAQEQDR